MSKIITADGPFRRVIEDQGGGKYVSQLQQPSRGLILERNAELRKNPGAIRNGQAMGLEYSIPTADYFTIMKRIRAVNPGAKARDMSALLRSWLERYGHCYKVRA